MAAAHGEQLDGRGDESWTTRARRVVRFLGRHYLREARRGIFRYLSVRLAESPLAETKKFVAHSLGGAELFGSRRPHGRRPAEIQIY